jgi:hypothetical protein
MACAARRRTGPGISRAVGGRSPPPLPQPPALPGLPGQRGRGAEANTLPPALATSPPPPRLLPWRQGVYRGSSPRQGGAREGQANKRPPRPNLPPPSPPLGEHTHTHTHTHPHKHTHTHTHPGEGKRANRQFNTKESGRRRQSSYTARLLSAPERCGSRPRVHA